MSQSDISGGGLSLVGITKRAFGEAVEPLGVAASLTTAGTQIDGFEGIFSGNSFLHGSPFCTSSLRFLCASKKKKTIVK